MQYRLLATLYSHKSRQYTMKSLPYVSEGPDHKIASWGGIKREFQAPCMELFAARIWNQIARLASIGKVGNLSADAEWLDDRDIPYVMRHDKKVVFHRYLKGAYIPEIMGDLTMLAHKDDLNLTTSEPVPSPAQIHDLREYALGTGLLASDVLWHDGKMQSLYIRTPNIVANRDLSCLYLTRHLNDKYWMVAGLPHIHTVREDVLMKKIIPELRSMR